MWDQKLVSPGVLTGPLQPQHGEQRQKRERFKSQPRGRGVHHGTPPATALSVIFFVCLFVFLLLDFLLYHVCLCSCLVSDLKTEVSTTVVPSQGCFWLSCDWHSASVFISQSHTMKVTLPTQFPNDVTIKKKKKQQHQPARTTPNPGFR